MGDIMMVILIIIDCDRDGKVHIKLRAILVNRFGCVRQGVPIDKQQRQERIRNKGDSDK